MLFQADTKSVTKPPSARNLLSGMCKVKGIPFPSCYGHGAKRQLSTKAGNETPSGFTEDDDDEDEDQEVVSAIRRSMEERRRRKTMYTPYDFSWSFPSATEKLFIEVSEVQDELSLSPAPTTEIMSVKPEMEEHAAQKETSAEDEEDDEFLSAASSLSDPSSSNGTIASMMKSLTECHWLQCDGKHVPEPWRKQKLLLLKELLDCEGWPFGLMRRVVLLPPLPNSPSSDSWSWAKTHKRARKSEPNMKRDAGKFSSPPLPLTS